MIMLRLPPTSNWIGCREEFQLAKYHLRNAERDIKAAMNLRYDFEIERALLTPACIRGEFYKLAENYKLSSREFDEASQHYEKACEIQRQGKMQKDCNIPTIAKSK